jgi:hypothetical protein
MAEPKNLDEALKGYQENSFSRKSLFEFVVADLKAKDARIDALERQNRDLMAALMTSGKLPPLGQMTQKPKGNGSLEVVHG